MQFNDLLREQNIDPVHVLIMRHRPIQPELRDVLPWFAAERPDIYHAYQQSQSQRAERALQNAKCLATFIGHKGGHAVFVCLYQVGKAKPITREQYWRKPANLEMRKFGLMGPTRRTSLWFELEPLKALSEWKGKLIVKYPQERAWFRWAAKNQFPIAAILEESALGEKMPDWREVAVSWEKLQVLPTEWKAKLSEWRGIYFIFDIAKHKGYVGSAYGKTNILGRWLNYGATGDGGNKLLRKCKRENLVFSILERASPDAVPDEIINLESSWKDRLQTREHGLNLN